MRPQEDIDAEIFDDAQLDLLAKKSMAAADTVAAIRAARRSCAEAGLDLTFDEHGVASLTTFQQHRIARHSKEDVSATLILQTLIMARLDHQRKYLWIIIVLLGYIAVRVS